MYFTPNFEKFTYRPLLKSITCTIWSLCSLLLNWSLKWKVYEDLILWNSEYEMNRATSCDFNYFVNIKTWYNNIRNFINLKNLKFNQTYSQNWPSLHCCTMSPSLASTSLLLHPWQEGVNLHPLHHARIRLDIRASGTGRPASRSGRRWGRPPWRRRGCRTRAPSRRRCPARSCMPKVAVAAAPSHMPKYHQLKKELLDLHSSGSDSSNWSAPNACMRGLCPPCANAIK